MYAGTWMGCTALIRGPLDGLLDPPGRVGAETGPLGGIEPLHGAEEADVALFDQVLERQAAVGIVFGDGDHQAEIGPDHPFA